MTVFGVARVRFITLTLQQLTPARSPHSRSPLTPSSLPTGQVGQIRWACSTTDTAMWQTHYWSVSGQRSKVARNSARDELSGVMGFEPLSWHVVFHGARPPFPDEFEPGSWRTGWQHEAASRVERSHREPVLGLLRCPPRHQASPLGFLPTSFVSCCCVGSAFPSLIVQRVRSQGCWPYGDLLWRMQWPECAARQAPGFH